MNKTRTAYALLSISFLTLGMIIYLLFRNINNMIIFEWLPGIKFSFNSLPVKINQTVFTDILLYNIPDMLWFVSGILFLRFIWFYNIKMQRVYIFCFYVIGITIELSQISDNVPGTFDFWDLLFMGIGAFVEGLLYKKIILRRKV